MAPIEIKAEAQDDRLQLLQALEAEGAPNAVVSDAESVSLDVPARRRQTAMPAPQPSAKSLYNDPLAPEAADVNWVFSIGIPKKNAQSARIHRHYLQFCLRHINSMGNLVLTRNSLKPAMLVRESYCSFHICSKDVPTGSL